MSPISGVYNFLQNEKILNGLKDISKKKVMIGAWKYDFHMFWTPPPTQQKSSYMHGVSTVIPHNIL